MQIIKSIAKSKVEINIFISLLHKTIAGKNMKHKNNILLIFTSDTKLEEGLFIREKLEEQGLNVIHLDASIRLAGASKAEITPDQIASASGHTIPDIRALNHEGKAQAQMVEGAVKSALSMHSEIGISGVIGIGGSMGTTLGTAVMRSLPFGIPKIMVSTIASGMTRPFVGTKDIQMFNSVADISGLNRITRRVFENAANALAGEVKFCSNFSSYEKPMILVSTLGTTEACSKSVRQKLEARGFEVVIFHTVGGGEALDEIAHEQDVAAVVDMSLSELNDHLNGGLCSAGPERAKSAIRKGVPTIFAPGNADFIIAGPHEEACKQFPGKRFHIHNAALTAIRTEKKELALLADHLANIINEGSGKVAINIPLHGFSAHDSDTGHLQDKSLPPVFAELVEACMPSRVKVSKVEAHINDDTFADSIVSQVIEFVTAKN